MKISINALKQIYQQAGTPDFLPDDINSVAQKIGAQLGEIEDIVDLGKKYEKIIVAKVVSCKDHPNADRLKLCTIDDGGTTPDVKRDGNGLIQVVCGAPNVTENMLAAWLPPGSIVPSTFDKEPFVLESRDIRGEPSNGMLASANELGINDDHTGILAIDKAAKPGDSFVELYKLDDYIIDIENKMFTHRPDCFGLLGIARELAGIYQKPFNSPDWYEENPKLPEIANQKLKLKVVNEIPELVPRFCAVAVSDVAVSPSPVWLQVALSKLGVKSINNIVDLTNFYMILTGQPTHAYDYDKVAELSGGGATIKARLANENEKLKLLNGKEINPAKNTIMIATDKQAIGVGGVIGGTETEVDFTTKNIIIECANFNSYSIRRTAMEHGIFTDAVTRFTKGQSPFQNLAVIGKITSDVCAISGGNVASEFIDTKGSLPVRKSVKISARFINSRLGVDLGSKDIEPILSNVEFKVEKKVDELVITPPFWRMDIEIPEDVVEEIGRLYGYDHLPQLLPKKSISPATVSEELRLKRLIRESLSAMGANELLNYSFVHGDLLESAGQDTAESFKLKNALSPDLQYYRQSLTPSLLEKVHPNIKLGFDHFTLFELGKVHIKGKETDGLPTEFSRLGLITASKNKKPGSAYYSARKYLVDLLGRFNVLEDEITFETIDPKDMDSAVAYYQSGRAANIKIGDEIIGRIGEYNHAVTSRLKLPEFCAGFEISLSSLDKLGANNSYKVISRYPSTDQDICLRTDRAVDFADIENSLLSSLEKNSPTDVDTQVKCIDIFSDEDKSKQTTFRISAVSFERTLTTDITNSLLDKVVADLKKSINATRV